MDSLIVLYIIIFHFVHLQPLYSKKHITSLGLKQNLYACCTHIFHFDLYDTLYVHCMFLRKIN